MTTPDEVRRFATVLELRDVQAVGRPYRYLEGRAVPYDTPADIGWFIETHAAGSFVKSTGSGSARALPLLLFHDNQSLGSNIGHAEHWRHDGGGLDGVWRLNDSLEAQTAAGMAEAGDLTGLSIGFQPRVSEWEWAEDWAPELGGDHKDRVIRRESRLLEVSLTPTPAFVDAEVSLVRSAMAPMTRAAGAPNRVRLVDTWRAELDRLRSG